MAIKPVMRRVGTALPGLLQIVAVILIVLGVWWFVEHSVGRGLRLGHPDERTTSRLFNEGAVLSNLSIYGHMLMGGLLTLLAPLQLLGVVRRRVPGLHRLLGYTVAGLAGVTGIAGLAYIAAQGTIGGPLMNAGFGLYGVLICLAAVQTVRLARLRDPAHRDWALRLVVLALGSWIFRIHYGLWHAFTDGAATTEDFRGLFDRVQTFAFYLPYLTLLEIYLRVRRNRLAFPSRRALAPG